MVKVLNMFREFSMRGVQGYNNLSNEQKDMFDVTYKKHLLSMSKDKRVNYSEDCLIKIISEASILKVYYNNGECYFYLPRNQWVKLP